jgi:hypothetical protein
MSGQWPPEWGDDEEFPEEAIQPDAEAEARLSEVAAYLASVPAPVLPDAIEARISTALSAESATRASRAATDESRTDGSRKVVPAQERGRARRRRGGGRGFRSYSVPAAMALVVCLVLAGLGFGLSLTGKTSMSSSADAGSAAAGSAEAPAGSSSAAGSSTESSAAAAPEPTAQAPGPAHQGPLTAFTVTTSGTKYRQATLTGQVRGKLAANAAQQAQGTAVPAAGANSPAPSSALRGCVLHVTGGTVPRLVDRATYQGEPVYVIATTSRVWVVEPGCTATQPKLIASVPLAGLPGNLRALVSVEQ